MMESDRKREREIERKGSGGNREEELQIWRAHGCARTVICGMVDGFRTRAVQQPIGLRHPKVCAPIQLNVSYVSVFKLIMQIYIKDGFYYNSKELKIQASCDLTHVFQKI